MKTETSEGAQKESPTAQTPKKWDCVKLATSAIMTQWPVMEVALARALDEEPGSAELNNALHMLVDRERMQLWAIMGTEPSQGPQLYGLILTYVTRGLLNGERFLTIYALTTIDTVPIGAFRGIIENRLRPFAKQLGCKDIVAQLRNKGSFALAKNLGFEIEHVGRMPVEV